MSVEIYNAGQTVDIWSYNKDWDTRVYTSPGNGIKVTVTDPGGVVKVNALAMTPIETGKFVYHYNSPVDGIKEKSWIYSCKSQDGEGANAFIVIKIGTFQLK